MRSKSVWRNLKNFYLKTTAERTIMNTTNKTTAEKGNIIIGEAKPLDIEKLLDLYGAATSARQKDGSVLIDADTLQQMTKELILTKLHINVPVVRSDTMEMKPMPGHAYAIATHPPVY